MCSQALLSVPFQDPIVLSCVLVTLFGSEKYDLQMFVIQHRLSIIFSNAVLPQFWLNTSAILVSQSACKQSQAVLHQHLSTYLMEHEACHSQKT